MHITNSLETLIEKGSIAWGLATLSLAVVLGLALGAVRVHGIRLGVSGVLFSALVFGQLGLTVNPQVLEFLRDFALIIFVYSVGLQVGPGFAASLREEGMRLNVLSILVVGLGALMTAGITKAVHLPPESATGLYSGAYTTTPGLGAGQDALAHLLADDPEKMHAAVARAGLAYTITYPFGILGPILMIVTLRKIFRIRMADEMSDLAVAEQVRRPPIAVVDLEVTNPAQAGIPLKSHPLLQASEVYFSRMLRNGVMSVPTGDTEIRVGDFYRAMGTKSAVAEIVAALGRPSTPDFNSASGDVQRTDFIVTRTDVLRRPLRDLDLIRRAGVAIGRVNRAGVDLFPRASMRLQFGDRVTAIGSEAGLKIVEGLLGNSPDRLNRPQLIPIFLGIVLGVLVGSIPIWIPGLHERVRIGLAGGADARRHRPFTTWQYRLGRLVHAGGRQPALPRFRLGGFPGVRRPPVRRSFSSARQRGRRNHVHRLGRVDHNDSGISRQPRRPHSLQNEFHHPLRLAGRGDDQLARPAFRQRYRRIGSAIGRLRRRRSAGAAHADYLCSVAGGTHVKCKCD
jgi:putative transport protein